MAKNKNNNNAAGGNVNKRGQAWPTRLIKTAAASWDGEPLILLL